MQRKSIAILSVILLSIIQPIEILAFNQSHETNNIAEETSVENQIEDIEKTDEDEMFKPSDQSEDKQEIDDNLPNNIDNSEDLKQAEKKSTRDTQDNEQNLEKTTEENIKRQENILKFEEEKLLKLGDNSKDVRRLKENLNALGFTVGMNYPNNFGPETEKVVKKFQSYYGFEPTGIVDEVILDKIDSLLLTSLKLGDNSEVVHQLKNNLNILGFSVSMNDPNNYGPATKRAVKDFQNYYELYPSGVAEETTLDKIDELLNQVLKLGDNSESVRQLKENLNKLGFSVSMNYPNNYGPATKRAVMNFQEFFGLHPSGVANEITLDRINELLNSPLKPGDNSPQVRLLKENLNKLGFTVGMNYPNNYGPATEKAVRNLQKHYSLEQNGIADEATLDVIEHALENSIKRGDNSEKVLQLKENLNLLTFSVAMNSPNNFGPATERALKAFQKHYNMYETGVADPPTLKKIQELIESPLKLGLTRTDVKELKIKLDDVGFFVSDNPTYYYGTVTQRVVTEFQEYYGIKVAEKGVADENTLKILEDVLKSSLKLNDNSSKVRELKEKLNILGFKVGMNHPNNYGPATKRAVERFQKHYDLHMSGVAEPKTLEKIEELISSVLQRDDHSDRVRELKENLNLLGFSVGMNYPNNYGPATERAVKEFQSYYGLLDNGIANEITLSKIEQVLKGALFKDQSSEEIKQLKENLNTLGFSVTMNAPNKFGPATERAVKEFQEHYGLKVTGVAEEKTLEKIDEILNSSLRRGQNSSEVRRLKEKLNKLGFPVTMSSPNNFGPATEQAVKDFQEFYNLPVSGIADEVTLALIDEILAKGYIKKTNYNITLDEAVKMQLKVSPQTDSKKYAWVSKKHIDKNSKVTASALNVRTQPNTSKDAKILGTLSKGTKVKVLDEYNGWYAIEYSHKHQWTRAITEDVRYYLDPNNFINDEKQRFQFLDLGSVSGATAKKLNDYLKDKGILKGQGQAFIEAGRTHGINEIYLISHALLETGNGTSELANGIEVGLNKKGKPEMVTEENKKNLTKIKKVYNMYGIRAKDNCPEKCGAEYAYSEGWTDPKKAIIGGAKFIGNSYIKAGQNTIYKMRWNPEAMAKSGIATHQYATDVGWASKQVTTMYNLYKSIKIFNLRLDIPIYK